MLYNLSNTINKTDKFVSTNQDNYNPSNIVFIDPRVDNFNSLLSGLKANVEAVVLDSTKDGIEQITEFLKSRTGAIDSIQILSHGSAGNLQLGSTQLNSENLGTYQESLKNWFSAASGKAPDLLLYGCDVASGEVGESFIQKLSQFTGADVAASVDLTGNAAKDGNWILEKATGAIEAGQAFTRKVRDTFQDILLNYEVTNTNDEGPGSLRQAIIEANKTVGNLDFDTITFNIAPGGPQTIKVGSTTGKPLPYIRDRVTIDGETQPGFSNTKTPIIVLDGTAVGGASAKLDGLRFVHTTGSAIYNPGFTVAGFAPLVDEYFYSGNASNSVVRGLVISNFSGNGIKIGQYDQYTTTGTRNVSNVLVERNYIGTDITGTVAKPTSTWGDPNNTHAINIGNSSNNTIRGNLVSGNFSSAITLFAASPPAGAPFGAAIPATGLGNIVSGNYVGTDVSGKFALGNQRWGVYTWNGNSGSAASGIRVTNNLISANGVQDEGNGERGLDIRARGIVSNNIIGTDRDKTYALMNRSVAFAYSGGAATNVTSNTIQGPGFPTGLPGSNTNPGFANFLAPTLTAGSPSLSAIPQNSTSNNGNLVKDIVGSSIGNLGSVTTPGIAITAASNPNGSWQYSTDNGFSWANINLAFPSTAGVNPWAIANFPAPNNPPVAPAVTPIFLLSADNKNRIRFIPNANYTGLATGITYRAWNQRFGGNGLLTNISANRRAATTSQEMRVILDNLSTTSVTAQINVIPNTAPTLVPNQVQPTSTFATAIKTTAGVVIGTALATSTTDPDNLAQKGVAITKLDSANGTWEYSITDAVKLAANFTDAVIRNPLWIPIPKLTGAVSETSALLLDSNAKLRFIPDAGFMGTPESATFRAWDQTNGSNGNRIDTTANGGATSVSELDVNILNFAPVLVPATVPTTKNQVNTTDGILVSDFAASAITDANLTNLKGLAITDAPSTDGTWQYSLDNGTSWTNIGAVSPTNALLLDIDNKIRFVPSVNETFDKDISFRAWDQTKGNPGERLDVGINGGSTSFSDKLATLTINIPIDPSKIPAAPIAAPISNSPIDPGLFPLLRNPAAPATPDPVIVGEPPVDSPDSPTPISDNNPSNPVITNPSNTPPTEVTPPQGTGTPNNTTKTYQGTDEDDFLVGTAEQESFYGKKGKDTLWGARGDDNLYGARGDDFIRGGRGKDVIRGGRGNDLIRGGRGQDLIYGGEGEDIIYGNFGKDTIYGGGENDRIYAGYGKDVLYGEGGNDFIRGGRGRDILEGGDGNDVLIGGWGNDTLTGGAGSDRFRLEPGKGTDTITDFVVGVDFIELAKGLRFADLQLVQGVGTTIVGVQPGTVFPSDKPLALLTGVTASSLTPNSFLPV